MGEYNRPDDHEISLEAEVSIPDLDEGYTGGVMADAPEDDIQDLEDRAPDDRDAGLVETPEPRRDITPLGIANELFETGGPEVGGVLQHPETIDDYRLHGIYSMAALAQVEHEAIVAGQRSDVAGNMRVTGGTRVEEYNIEDYQGSTIPVPPSNVVADYIERVDDQSGELEYVVKIQPQPDEPDFDNPNLSLQEAMRLQAEYEQDLADRPEIIWESATAHRLKVITGSEIKEIQDLPVGQVVDLARFLRTAAIRAAAGRRNIPVLERILPHDPDIPTPITGLPHQTEE